ncbi:MAG: hypothetical protein ABSD62_10235 [Candidatus Limnocylindrales bacterium]|jgi:hypothetical protein
MNGQSTEDRGNNADRRIGEWADLSATSHPLAARPEVLRASVEAGVMERRGSRRSVPGLAMVMLVVLVVAGVGFAVSRQRSVVAPSASASAVASASVSANPSASPRPSASPQPLITSPGDRVFAMGRTDERSGWAFLWSIDPTNVEKKRPMLLVTEDGGATWRDATPRRTGFGPVIEFVDADHGWYLSGPMLWRTTDGARSWQETSLPTPFVVDTAAMSFVSASTGYLLAPADSATNSDTWVVYRTDDGGASLQAVSEVVLPGETASSSPDPAIAFSDRLDGVVAGWNVALQTHDGGAHWSPVDLPAPVGSKTATYVGLDQLRAFGPYVVLLAWMGGPGATAYLSDDAGRTWRQASTAWSQSTSDIWAIVDGQTWLDFTAAGSGSIQVGATSDAGRSWTELTFPFSWRVTAASFVSATDGWAILGTDCRASSDCWLGRLAQTHDGGVTWQPVQ